VVEEGMGEREMVVLVVVGWEGEGMAMVEEEMGMEMEMVEEMGMGMEMVEEGGMEMETVEEEGGKQEQFHHHCPSKPGAKHILRCYSHTNSSPCCSKYQKHNHGKCLMKSAST